MQTVGLSDAQLANRRLTLGASEIAAVVGMSPWSSPFDVWAQKRGLAPAEPQTDAQQFGSHLEPAILSLYNARVGPCVGNRETFAHPFRPWATATPDGFVPKPSVGPRGGREFAHLIECKAVSGQNRREWGDGYDDVPVHYLLQVQWQMYVCGYDRTDLVALIGLDEFRVYPVLRDDELVSMLVEEGEAFWRRHIVGDETPAIGESNRTARVLQAMYPSHRRPLERWTPEAMALAETCAARKREAAQAAARAEEASNRLRQHIGDGEGFCGGKGEPKVTWRSDKQGKVSWAALAKELGATPEQINRHRGKPGRTLRLHGFDTGEEEAED